MKKLEGWERGINLGGWLSQCDHTKETYDHFIQKEDIKKIAGWGLDHVRVPVDYVLVEDADGNEIPEGYAYIDKAVSWCEEYGLNMILDLHRTFGFSFDKGENEKGFFENKDYQERFCRLWERLATRYGNKPDRLALELLNEVTEMEYMDTWKEVYDTCIRRIRAIAPDVKIIVGGYHNNSIEALPALLPPQDENIVYTFHCYEPLIFTHQGAYWISTMDTSFRMSINEPYRKMQEYSDRYLEQVAVGFDGFDPESSLDVSYFDKHFKEAVDLAEERNVALYCGEYGVIDLADPQEILKWYRIIHEAFEKHGIGRAAWCFRKKDFGFVDEHMEPVLDEILKLL